jgi:hypothetical protein
MNKPKDHSEVSAKGGNATKQKYGKDHFAKLGKLRGEQIRKDPEYVKKLSAAGVEGRRKKREEKKRQEQEAQKPLNKLTRILTGN